MTIRSPCCIYQVCVPTHYKGLCRARANSSRFCAHFGPVWRPQPSHAAAQDVCDVDSACCHCCLRRIVGWRRWLGGGLVWSTCCFGLASWLLDKNLRILVLSGGWKHCRPRLSDLSWFFQNLVTCEQILSKYVTRTAQSAKSVLKKLNNVSIRLGRSAQQSAFESNYSPGWLSNVLWSRCGGKLFTC